MSFALIILAGGSSSRLGRPKQLLNYNGRSLLQHVLQVAKNSIARPIIVVLGANHELISEEISEDKNIHAVINNEWNDGISSSIRTGIKYLQQISNKADGVVITVCDQPFITSSLLNEIIDAQTKAGKPIIASSYENTIGTPALFHKSVFAELLTLKGDTGAKKIMMQQKENVAVVPFPLGNIDIDTDADYNALNIPI